MDTLFTALRVAVSLGLIIGLIWFVQRKSAKSTSGKGRRPITVVAKHSLGGKSRMVIVEADGTHFVLGVTESSVVVLKSRRALSFSEALIAEEGQDRAAASTDGQESIEPVAALARPQEGAVRGRRAARPNFTESITSIETWRKAAQSLRTTR